MNRMYITKNTKKESIQVGDRAARFIRLDEGIEVTDELIMLKTKEHIGSLKKEYGFDFVFQKNKTFCSYLKSDDLLKDIKTIKLVYEVTQKLLP